MATTQRTPKIVLQGLGESSEEAVTEALEGIGIDPNIIRKESAGAN